MKVKCLRCKSKKKFNKGGAVNEILKYAEKGIYLCQPCRRKVILEELKRLLDEKLKKENNDEKMPYEEYCAECPEEEIPKEDLS